MKQLIGKTDVNCVDNDTLTRKSIACFMIISASLIITLGIRESF